MIEILVAVCLIDQPERCKDVHLSFMEESVTPTQCMMMGQIEIARWMESNPKWALKRWSCQPAGRIAKI